MSKQSFCSVCLCKTTSAHISEEVGQWWRVTYLVDLPANGSDLARETVEGIIHRATLLPTFKRSGHEHHPWEVVIAGTTIHSDLIMSIETEDYLRREGRWVEP